MGTVAVRRVLSGVGPGVRVAVGVGVGVEVAVAVGVAVGVGVEVGAAVGVGVAVGTAVEVGTAVGVGVAVGPQAVRITRSQALSRTRRAARTKGSKFNVNTLTPGHDDVVLCDDA